MFRWILGFQITGRLGPAPDQGQGGGHGQGSRGATFGGAHSFGGSWELAATYDWAYTPSI